MVSEPVPLLSFGGTSFLPVNAVLNVTVSATAKELVARNAESANPAKPRRLIMDRIDLSSRAGPGVRAATDQKHPECPPIPPWSR
jgi:hypothetical protein